MRAVKGKRFPLTQIRTKLAAVSAFHEASASWRVVSEFIIICVAAGVPCC
jgi:hypothetical protein